MNEELLSRRKFMRHALPAAAGTALVILTGCRAKSNPPPPATVSGAAARPSPPSTPPPEAPAAPQEIVITPNDQFYVMESNGTPQTTREDWTLTLDGLVDNPQTFSWSDLHNQPKVEIMRTLECIGNAVGGNQIGNAVWGGCHLAPLLAAVGVQETAVRAIFSAADGYSTSVTMDRLSHSGTFLAYEMNGEQLPPEHGFPLRIFMPGLYGQKMPKWLSRINFSANQSHLGTWEKLGWSNTAEVKTNSIIQIPTHIQKLPLTAVEIFGVAYAGERKITAVEIGIEGENETRWQPADYLIRGEGNGVWTQFYLTWTPPGEGTYTLLVRATDESGFVQSERARGILQGAFPDGTDKIHNIVVVVQA